MIYTAETSYHLQSQLNYASEGVTPVTVTFIPADMLMQATVSVDVRGSCTWLQAPPTPSMLISPVGLLTPTNCTPLLPECDEI